MPAQVCFFMLVAQYSETCCRYAFVLVILGSRHCTFSKTSTVYIKKEEEEDRGRRMYQDGGRKSHWRERRSWRIVISNKYT
jgi:hypothetical protein